MRSGEARQIRMPTWVVAGGMVAMVAWFVLSPGGRVAPSGAAATAVQSQISSLVSAAGGGVSTAGCSMAGNKHLTISCPVSGLQTSALRNALETNGWKPASTPPLSNSETHLAFTSEGLYLTVDAHSSGAVQSVSVMLR
jgi:hypothetical protein